MVHAGDRLHKPHIFLKTTHICCVAALFGKRMYGQTMRERILACVCACVCIDCRPNYYNYYEQTKLFIHSFKQTQY